MWHSAKFEAAAASIGMTVDQAKAWISQTMRKSREIPKFKVGDEILTAEELWDRLSMFNPEEPAGRTANHKTSKYDPITYADFLETAYRNPDWVQGLADGLKSKESDNTDYLNSPAALLVQTEIDFARQIREGQEVTDLIAAQQRLLARIIRLPVAKREEYFEKFAASGIPEKLMELHTLDQRVLELGDDAPKKLAAARAYLQSQARGYAIGPSLSKASKAKEQLLNARENAARMEQQTATARAELAVKIQETLQLTNGNKSETARLLGISRERVLMVHPTAVVLPAPE